MHKGPRGVIFVSLHHKFSSINTSLISCVPKYVLHPMYSVLPPSEFILEG